MVVEDHLRPGASTPLSGPPSPEIQEIGKSSSGSPIPNDVEDKEYEPGSLAKIQILTLSEVNRIFRDGTKSRISEESSEQRHSEGGECDNGQNCSGLNQTEIHVQVKKDDLQEHHEEVEVSAGSCSTPKIDISLLNDDQLQTALSDAGTSEELGDARAHLSDATRRVHDLEVEVKRLENEREELSIAYREAESMRKQEEAKAQRLSSELASVRHDFERRITIKEEEIESLRKQMAIEIDQLSQRLAEAEAKVKTEVSRIKKKMQIQITEIEMSLDVANKQNIDMQKTIKFQSTKITELQSHYDEVHRQLQQCVDQLGVSQRRCQALTAEVEELRVTLEQTLRAKRSTEQQLEESQSRNSELTTINVNLTSIKGKLENEYMAIQNDYEEISKELRISDERYNRIIVELKSTKDLLVEEQERIVKIESIKKSLEVEVRTLQVRIEEVEVNALAGGRRVVSKLESRIRDMEVELDEEKKRHGETQKIARKKDHRCKELILQTEEDHKTISMLNDAVEKLSEKIKVYKRQLSEQEGMTSQNLSRVRRFQRELEAAEDRAEQAESNLSFVRSRHRTIVTGPASMKQVLVTTTEETTSSSSQY